MLQTEDDIPAYFLRELREIGVGVEPPAPVRYLTVEESRELRRGPDSAPVGVPGSF